MKTFGIFNKMPSPVSVRRETQAKLRAMEPRPKLQPFSTREAAVAALDRLPLDVRTNLEVSEYIGL